MSGRVLTRAIPQGFLGLSSNGNVFVTVASNGNGDRRSYSSTDGVTWTMTNIGHSSNYGRSGTLVPQSDTRITTFPSKWVRDGAEYNSMAPHFIAMGNQGLMYRSGNGINWSGNLLISNFCYTAQFAAYSGGRFVSLYIRAISTPSWP